MTNIRERIYQAFWYVVFWAGLILGSAVVVAFFLVALTGDFRE